MASHPTKRNAKPQSSSRPRKKVNPEERKRKEDYNISMYDEPKKNIRKWNKEELEEECWKIGKSIYNEFATERQRLLVKQLSLLC